MDVDRVKVEGRRVRLREVDMLVSGNHDRKTRGRSLEGGMGSNGFFNIIRRKSTVLTNLEDIATKTLAVGGVRIMWTKRGIER